MRKYGLGSQIMPSGGYHVPVTWSVVDHYDVTFAIAAVRTLRRTRLSLKGADRLDMSHRNTGYPAKGNASRLSTEVNYLPYIPTALVLKLLLLNYANF